jgi:uncharacterized OB-fold protein
MRENKNTKTFKCPKCGCKVLDNTCYCTSCKKKVKKESTLTEIKGEISVRVYDVQTGDVILQNIESRKFMDLVKSQYGGLSRNDFLDAHIERYNMANAGKQKAEIILESVEMKQCPYCGTTYEVGNEHCPNCFLESTIQQITLTEELSIGNLTLPVGYPIFIREESYNPEEMMIAQKTSRNWKTTATSEAVRKYIKPGDKILDYGAGKNAIQAVKLRAEGYDVTAYDFWANPEVHDMDALKKKYDVVYASNVLNVQSSEDMFRRTMNEISSVLVNGGIFVGNYPETPRKWVEPQFPDFKGVSSAPSMVLEDIMREYFSSVERIKKGEYNPMWLCRK